MGWGSRKKRGGLLADGGLVQIVQIHAKGPVGPGSVRAWLGWVAGTQGQLRAKYLARAPGLLTCAELPQNTALAGLAANDGGYNRWRATAEWWYLARAVLGTAKC